MKFLKWFLVYPIHNRKSHLRQFIRTEFLGKSPNSDISFAPWENYSWHKLACKIRPSCTSIVFDSPLIEPAFLSKCWSREQRLFKNYCHNVFFPFLSFFLSLFSFSFLSLYFFFLNMSIYSVSKLLYLKSLMFKMNVTSQKSYFA